MKNIILYNNSLTSPISKKKLRDKYYYRLRDINSSISQEMKNKLELIILLE